MLAAGAEMLRAGKILGFAPLIQVPAGCAFAAEDAPIVTAAGRCQGRVRIGERDGKSAAVFVIDDAETGLVATARRGALTARADLERKAGIAVVHGLTLVRDAYGGTAWPAELPQHSLPEALARWWQPALLASLGISRRPSGGRAKRSRGLGITSINLNGVISVDSVRTVRSLVKFAAGTSINLHINSSGGNLSEALDIYRRLRAHRHRVDVNIVGEASSAAAIVAMAGDERKATRGSVMLIHRPLVDGPHNREAIRAIAAAQADMATILAEGTGRSRAVAMAWMASDVRFSADQALQAGLVHGIVER